MLEGHAMPVSCTAMLEALVQIEEALPGSWTVDEMMMFLTWAARPTDGKRVVIG